MKNQAADSRTLAVRCLNETRLLHPPTYVASRFLIESLAGDNASIWIRKTITRRYPVQTKPRFFRFLRFKKERAHRQPEYREFLVPSPMTCLAEAVVLDAMSRSPAFAKPQSVYSYLWPRSAACPYNFEHYSNGYRDRNAAIAAALRAHPGKIAVVTDIEKFYPSISHELLRQKFTARVADAGFPPEIAATASSLFDHLLAEFTDGKGIATAPELSHVLGDLALADVDAEFGRRLPGMYFRYVDDIVLLIDPQEKQRELQALKNVLSQARLTTNLDKTDFVSSDEWLAHGPEYVRGVNEYSFEALVFRLKLFLSNHPNRFDNLRSALLAEGFSIPLGRFRAAAMDRQFIRRVKFFWRHGWRVLRLALTDNEHDVVKYALAVRKAIRERLTSLLEADISNAPTRRRWHVQRIRYLTNRALYLLPDSDLNDIRDALAPMPEFVETSALIRTIQYGEAASLLNYPGAAVAAAAALLSARAEHRPRFELPDNFSPAAVDSAAVLLLYDVAELKPDVMRNMTTEQTEYLSFCAGVAPSRRQLSSFDYLDEIRSLQLQRPSPERTRVLCERFSNREELAFEALGIGEDYFT